MKHEDQIEFYKCPLCGIGTGNDLEKNGEDEEHDCPVAKEMRAEDDLLQEKSSHMEKNSEKIILDLCGGTGSWARPYAERGYKVVTITLPDYSVLDYKYDGALLAFPSITNKEIIGIKVKDIVGVLAAPPCTMFSFSRTKAKKPRDLREGMECVRACLDIIWRIMEVEQATGKKTLPLQFWALENPYHGFLKKFLGKPVFTFDPWEFGDGYQKRTALWGHFNEPIKTPVPMTPEAKEKAKTNSHLHTLGVKFDYLKSKDIHPEHFGKFDRQTRRSITPRGFAEAFYKANKMI